MTGIKYDSGQSPTIDGLTRNLRRNIPLIFVRRPSKSSGPALEVRYDPMINTANNQLHEKQFRTRGVRPSLIVDRVRLDSKDLKARFLRNGQFFELIFTGSMAFRIFIASPATFLFVRMMKADDTAFVGFPEPFNPILSLTVGSITVKGPAVRKLKTAA